MTCGGGGLYVATMMLIKATRTARPKGIKANRASMATVWPGFKTAAMDDKQSEDCGLAQALDCAARALATILAPR